MIIYFPLDIKKLVKIGRKYPWPKLKRCRRCSGCRVWGHGFVSGWFDGFAEPIPIKRCRCPDCHCIFRLKPKGYFSRFQADIATIRASIFSKANKGKWLAGIGKTRQCHWFRALVRKIKVFLTDTWDKGIVQGFDELVRKGIVPVSRSF